MKHLISLSLKYIKRQKLRSTLTFLCITLSIFILGIFGSFFSSILTTMKNEEIKNNGSWEADLTSIMEACDDPDIETKYDFSADAAVLAANHPAISDLHYQAFYDLNGNSFRNENNGGITYFDVKLDNGNFYKASSIRQSIFYGNEELRGSNYYAFGSVKEYKTDRSVIIPDTFKDYGYEVGDEISMTITPVWGMIDMDCEAVTDGIEKIKSANALGEEYYYFTMDGEEFPESDNYSNATSNFGAPLIQLLSKFDYTLDDIEFINEKRGASVTYQFVIDGFSDSSDLYNTGLTIQTPVTTDLNLDKLLEDNSEIFANSEYYTYAGMNVRTSDSLEFEDALMMYYKDLGLPEGDFYTYINPYEHFHEELLALELKGADAMMTLLPVIIVGLFLAFIAWAISRFVIDNAFEISVQERSSQFAALRIMGASRNQLLALILTEATFYCFTALPIGMITAFLLCKSAITSMKLAGFSSFEFSINPIITIICIALCILAIYISAYTSAMWAARKLSPAEALNYGKPQRKKQTVFKKRQRKSKSSRSNKGFIISYTFKNILRTKKRFLISTIAMALGVLLFSYCSMLGIYSANILNKYSDQDGYDFVIESYSAENIQSAVETFCDNELFSSVRIDFNTHYQPETKADSDTLNTFENYIASFRQHFYAIDRYNYEKYCEELTGITYDEFIESKAGIVAVSPYGTPEEIECDDNGYAVRIRENSFKSYDDLGFDSIPSVNFILDYSNSGLPEPAGSTPVNLCILGTICFEHEFYSIILPIENLTETFTDFCSSEEFYAPLEYYTTTLIVSDNNAYEDALKTVNNWYRSSTENGYFFDNYIAFTGRHSLIMAIVKTILIFLIAIWLTGILSTVNSINTSVLNRQRELIMMRSVGMSKKQLLGTVVIESLLFSSVSTIIGLIFGTSAFLFTILVVFRLPFKVSLIPMIIFVIVINLMINMIISVLSALPAIQTLSKSLKQQNI